MTVPKTRTLSDRLNIQEALQREEYKFTIKFSISVESHIRFRWSDIGIMGNGQIRFQHSEVETLVSPYFHIILEEDWTFNENRGYGETANPADPIVHESDDHQGYITVNYQNGDYEWFEFNFRVRDGVAYLGSKTKLKKPTPGRGWVPPEVEEAVHDHYPELEVTSEKPYWWE